MSTKQADTTKVGAVAEAAAAKSSSLAKVIAVASVYRRRLVLACFFSVLNKLLDLAPPFLIGLAVDTVVGGSHSLLAQHLGILDPAHQLYWLAGLTLAVWGGESLTEYCFLVYWRNLAQWVEHDLRTQSFAHLQSLDLEYFEDRPSGDLLSLLGEDVNQLERFLDNGANELIQLGVTIVSLGAFFFVVAPEVAWMAFLPMPIIIWGSLRFQTRMTPHYAAVRKHAAVIASQIANTLGGIATVKSFTAEDRELARLRNESLSYQSSNSAAIRYSSAFVPLIRMAIVSGFITTLIYGGKLTLSGELNVGVYSTLVFMTQRLLWPLTRLGVTLDLYQRAMASADRIFGLLDERPGIKGGKDSSTGPSQKALGLSIEDLHFSYSRGEKVLRGIDIEIPAGTTCAIVGATGSGKSTLLKLLLRYYDATSGILRIDGKDIREYPLPTLRHQMSFVSQDAYLFNGTIEDNLRYGKESATEDELRAALDLAECLAFVDSFPQGLQTVVGERGQKLSGGQRQRISIARAVLKNAPILILDEATSAVDNETEAAIQRSLQKIAKECTMIVVAHRLSTVRKADCIHVLDEGRIAERGTHDELLAQGGVYSRLWAVQTGA